MKPVDREKVKETVGADRAVTKTLYHYSMSVSTQERGFFAWGLVWGFFYLVGWVFLD